MYNKTFLIGYVGNDPVIRDTEHGQFATFRLCTSKSWQGANGDWQEREEWHSCSIGRDDLTHVAERIRKGTLLFVEGEITYNEAEQGGSRITYTNIRVKTYRVVPRTAAGAGEQAEPQAADDQEAAE